MLGMSWATTTSRSDDDPKYRHTKLLPRVVHEGTPRKFGKTWELKAPLREARWKDELSTVAWPSEQVLHNGRVKLDSNVSGAVVGGTGGWPTCGWTEGAQGLVLGARVPCGHVFMEDGIEISYIYIYIYIYLYI